MWLVILLFPLFTGMDGAGRVPDEKASLLEREKELTEKIVKLRRDQDFLIFKKEMYAADSKYLLLNLSQKHGTLKYKNRILMDFKFTSSSAAGLKGIPEGRVILTRKTEGSGRKYALSFGKAFIMQPKRVKNQVKDNNTPRLFLSKKDMAAIFYAVEAGSMAYILR